MATRERESGKAAFLLYRVSVIAISFVFLLAPRLAKSLVDSWDAVELITYFRTQLPPGKDMPVCLIGGTTPIGTIKSVDLVPHHDEYYEAWKVVMEINEPDARGITADSVADANPSGPCGVLINVYGNGPPIAYRTLIKGEVTYFAETPHMLPPKPWWQPGLDFLSMDIGLIWIELGAGILAIPTSILVLVGYIRRERRNTQA
jgi:hypothetical protein